MKTIILTLAILILSGCMEDSIVLKQDTLMCKTEDGFAYNVKTHMSYMIRYGSNQGTLLYEKSMGCETLPKMTTVIIMERGKEYTIVKTEAKEIGYIQNSKISSKN